MQSLKRITLLTREICSIPIKRWLIALLVNWRYHHDQMNIENTYRIPHSLIWVIVFVLMTIELNAQEQRDTFFYKTKLEDYIIHADTLVNFKFTVSSEDEWFVLKGDNFKYDIRPNFALGASIGVSYKFLSASFGFIPKFIPGNSDNDLKGKSRAFSFKLNLVFNKWGQQLAIGKTQGYFLANTADFDASWQKGDPYIQLPDLKVQFFRGNTFYKFNANYSIKAVSTQSEIQIKSSGSFIPALDYSLYNIDNKSNDTAQKTSQRSQNFDGVLELGYFYSFVFNKKWYVAVGLVPGIGYGNTKLTTRYPDENINTHYGNAIYRIKEAAGLGYNTTRFFTGCEFRLSQSLRNDNVPAVKQVSSRLFFQVFAGYRFIAPKFLKKSVNYMEDKTHF